MPTTLDLPDWVRGIVLFAQTPAGEFVPVLVDASGQINILMRGDDGTGTIRTVRVDSLGQLYAVLRGAGGIDVSVDATGNLSALLKGLDGVGALHTVTVDTSGRLIMVPRGNSGNYLAVDALGCLTASIKGADGVGTPYVVLTDSDGRLIMVPRGDSGYYMSVDANGYLTAVLKGAEAGGTLHTLLTDTSGRAIMVPRGNSGYYMAVDVDGNLTAVLRGTDAGGTLRAIQVDTSGQMIMVPRGASGNYMSIDASGYMTAVLKGIQAGTLTTIAVDADGRIQAFMVDAEDQWGGTVVTGNAGLAAKLGSMQNWDYRGQVFYQTDFGQGSTPWLKYPVGAGSAIAIDPTMWLTGGYSLKLTAGSDGDHSAYIECLIQRPPSGKLGCEIVWSKDLTTAYVLIELRLYIGGVVYYGRLRYSNVDNRMEYYTSGGTWAYYGNPYFVSSEEAFNRMKLVVDVAAKQYVRALWGQTEQSMAGLGLYNAGTGFLNAMYVHLENTGRAGNNDVVYLDRVILTAGEPA